MSKFKILITGTGGCGVGEGIYKSLNDIDDYSIYSCNSSDNSLFFFDKPERSFKVPWANHPSYCDTILSICHTNQINVIIPGSEQELVVLVKNRNIFTDSNILILANTEEVINTFDNKWETFVKLNALGIKTPDTTLRTDDELFFNRNTFPVIVKPIYGNASKNVFVIDSAEQLLFITNYLTLKDVNYVIQEYVGSVNEEYTISVLSDFSGNFLGSIVLKRILSGGFSQFVECEEFEELNIIAQNIAKQINSKGPLNIQARIMNGSLYVFEINPRFSGTSPFRSLMGFNEADVLLSKIINGLNKFDKKRLKVGYFGVRGFQEKIYNNNVKY